MAGALSTLGLGSQGVLTNDLLDKLKAADKTATINPLEQSKKSLTLQQAGLIGLKDAIADLTELSTSLSDLALYQSKNISVTGESVKVEATSSAIAQNLSVRVWNIATKDIHESSAYASKTDTLDAGSMQLEVDGTTYDITIDATDTLETLATKISEQTEGKIDASIMNVGGDKPFKMILKSTETGSDNRIISSGDIDFSQVGNAAQNASLRVDGILISSPTNEIKDVVEGVTITILKQERSTETITIEQDSEKITEKMEEFVTKYNELLDSVKTLTNYDVDTKVSGVFQGTSEIKGMLAPLKDIFASTISSAGKMVGDFGIETALDGRITFDKDKFKEILADDTLAVQNFFIGAGEEKGIFRNMNTKLFQIGTSSDGILKTLKSGYDAKEKTILASLEKAQGRLDAKYDIMQQRFASYDAVIGRLSNTSNTLTALIDAQNGQN